MGSGSGKELESEDTPDTETNYTSPANINTEIPLSLTGYIHEYEISNSCVIPFGVVLIMCDYMRLVEFEWDKENTTTYATFLSNKTVAFSGFGIVIGNITLSKNIYKTYSFSIKIDRVGTNSLFYGFVYAPFDESIIDWDTWYCIGGNNQYHIRKRQIAVEVWHCNHVLCGYGGEFV
eukprot:76200_1